ncbi:MAG: diaminopimelate epimerase [Flavobacteriaceae bacterium]
MLFPFVKYQGTGNDFVLIDNREANFPIANHEAIAQLCHRNFGIGADGFICIESDDTSDFYMRYFNADGHEGSLCGNGSRCAIHYAKTLGLTTEKVVFTAADGVHHAQFINNEIALELHDVSQWERHENAIFLNTGSPHHMVFVDDVDVVDVATVGQEIAHGAPYFSDGTNVNFVQQLNDNTIKVRTYERGVEAETLSCGTGVTAAALAMHISEKSTSEKIYIQTLGGKLSVSFSPTQNGYTAITLQGPAAPVFTGNWEIN